MKLILLALAIFGWLISPVWAGVSPESAEWTLYKVVLFEDPSCTGASQTLFEDVNGQTFNFIEKPTLGEASISNGTFKCIAIKMRDKVTFVPKADEGTACVAGTSYSIDVCQSGFSVQGPAGASSTCTDEYDDIWIYISTWSIGTQDVQTNPFMPPVENNDANYGMMLDGSLSVASDTTGVFVIDTTGSIETSSGDSTCDMGQPLFGFR